MINKEELRAFMNELLAGNGNYTDELKEKYEKCEEAFREFDRKSVEINTLARKAKQLLTIANEKENSVKLYMQKTEATTIAETVENMHMYSSRLKEFSEAMEEYDLVNQKLKALFEEIAPIVDKEYSYGELIIGAVSFSAKKHYINDWESIRVSYYGVFDKNCLIETEKELEVKKQDQEASVDKLIFELQNFAKENSKKSFFKRRGA